jgi:uncharacterized protein YjiS (DUF1127 family)
MEYYTRRAGRLRVRWLHAWVRGQVRRAVRYLGRSRIEAELHALDARTLKDIGISRSDVPGIASGDHFRDDSRYPRRWR